MRNGVEYWYSTSSGVGSYSTQCTPRVRYNVGIYSPLRRRFMRFVATTIPEEEEQWNVERKGSIRVKQIGIAVATPDRSTVSAT